MIEVTGKHNYLDPAQTQMKAKLGGGQSGYDLKRT